MKINLTSNGKAYGYGTFRSVLDFFFPIGNRIRQEGTASFSNGKSEYTFFTFRNFFVHYFYEFFINPIRYWNQNAIKFAKSLGMNPAYTFRIGAVALDTSNQFRDTTPATSFTNAYTVTGSNPILFCGGNIYYSTSPTTETITGVTYNSVSMTLVNSTSTALNYLNRMFGILNPSTGNNNIVISTNQTVVENSWVVASYSGADQSTSISSLVNVLGSHTGGGTMTTTLSVPVDNSWTVLIAKFDNTGSAGTGSTERQYVATEPCGIYDSNGALPIGNYSMSVSVANVQPENGIMVSFAPFGATPGGGAVTRRRMLMGIGQ